MSGQNESQKILQSEVKKPDSEPGGSGSQQKCSHESDLARAELVRRNPVFAENMRELEKLESDRAFCKHGIAHSLDVARAALILALEEGRDIRKDVIYACALLHDLGRVREYRDGTPHEEAGAALAREILPEAGFTEDEIAAISAAIIGHRNDYAGEEVKDRSQAATSHYAISGSDVPAAKGSADADSSTLSDENRRDLVTSFSDGKDEIRGALCSVLARADKLVRPCFSCPAENQCKWPPDKKNQTLVI